MTASCVTEAVERFIAIHGYAMFSPSARWHSKSERESSRYYWMRQFLVTAGLVRPSRKQVLRALALAEDLYIARQVAQRLRGSDGPIAHFDGPFVVTALDDAGVPKDVQVVPGSGSLFDA